MAIEATQVDAPEVPTIVGGLREMDEREFIQLFEYLKMRTHGFREFPPELLLENNGYVLPLRLCLSLSQRELGKELGVTKDWVRHTESGRNKIMHLMIANRYAGKIESLLNQKMIDLECALESFSRYKFSRDQNLPAVETKFKSFRQMNEEDFKRYFELISRKTNGFTKFGPQLLIKIPQSLMILRIALGIDYREFAKLLGITGRALRKYEHLKMQLKNLTAVKFTKKITQLFDGKAITLDDALDNFRWLSGTYGRGKLSSYVERGLRFAQRIPPNTLEKEVRALLEKESIPFTMHARVRGLKRDYTVDFAIPDFQDPKAIIEVIRSEVVPGKKCNYRFRICLIDHEFQMIKARHPGVITILILNCSSASLKVRRVEKTIRERVRDMIQIETLNTDLFAITEGETKEIIRKLKGNSCSKQIKKENNDILSQIKPCGPFSPPSSWSHHVA